MRRRDLLAAAPALLAARAARAQLPGGPIRILIGFAPGGAVDQTARIAADAIQRRTGRSVVVEGRTGALGFIAAQAVARAVPDGSTLGMVIMGMMSVAPIVPGSNIPIDVDRDLRPICNLTSTPMALVVAPDAPYRSVAELVAYAKARPGELSYGSTGNGSTNQLAAEQFSAVAGLRMVHVAYRGGILAALDIAAGRLDLLFGNIAEIQPLIQAGQLRPLALASARPSALAPGLPLLTADYPALDMNNWFGLAGPAGIPDATAAALAELFTGALADPATTAVLEPRGLVAVPEDGAAFAAHIRRDRARWAAVVQAAGIRAD